MDNTRNISDSENSNQYVTSTCQLSRTRKVAYGVGHVLNDICASMWFTYLLVYLHLVLGFSPTSSGGILLIGQIADALATPFVGFQSDKDDNFWLCKYGKRKTWHLLGTICVLTSFPFIFSECIGCKNADQWAQMIYYAAFVIIFQFGWAAVQISHLALVPELTRTEQERTELTAIRYSFTVLSNVLIYFITWAVLRISHSNSPDAQIGPKDADKFQIIVVIGITIGIITSIVFHFLTKEKSNRDLTDFTQRSTRSASVVLKDVQLYQVACIYTPTRLFVNLTQIYVPLYLHETLRMSATALAVIPLLIYCSSFNTSLIVEKLNTKLGRKMAYSIGVVLGVIACVWIWCGSGKTFVKYEVYPVSLLLGAGGSVMLVTSLGLTADLIGANTESGAFVYGIMSFTDKLCNGIAVIIIQYIRQRYNYPHYYRDILVFVCGGAAIFGSLMMLGMKPFVRDNGYTSLQIQEAQDSEAQDVTSSSSTAVQTEESTGTRGVV